MTAVPLFLVILFGALAALFTVPGTVELAFLTIGGILPTRRKTKPVAQKAPTLKIAVVIPAHDEEGVIQDCVRSILACDAAGVPFSVFVVADNCSDQTASRAQSAGAQVLARNDVSHRGKGYALDFAFQQLLPLFDFFIVIDADTTVTPNLIREFAQASACAAALQCRYQVRNPGDSSRTRWMNIALMAFNVLRPKGRHRLGLSAGIYGNGFALPRTTLEEIPYNAVSVVEDLEYHLRLVRAGKKVEFVNSVTVYGEMPTGGKGVATQRARWEGGRIRMLSSFGPRLLRDLFCGRMRMLEPLLDLLLLPLAFHVMLLSIALLCPLSVVRIYAVSSLSLVLIHLLSAIAIGGGSWADVRALFTAPFYILWKVTMIPRLVVSAKKDTTWVRTARTASPGGSK